MSCALDLAKVLHLPRSLYLTLRKCCACHAIQPLGKLDLAKVLRLPRNLYLTLPKCCACHAVQSLGKLHLAKVLRLPRNLYLTLQKYCACHGIQTLRNLRVAVPMGPRQWSDNGPTRRREQASFQFSGHANSRTGPRFWRTSILPPHARASFLARLFLLLSSVSGRASFQLVAVTRKFLLDFL